MEKVSSLERRSIGSPMKYAYLLILADENTLYTAATLARLGIDRKKEPESYRRAKAALSEFARYHEFPTEVDGKVGRYNAWYGKSWKAAARPEDLSLAQPRLPARPSPQKRKTSGNSAGLVVAVILLLLLLPREGLQREQPPFMPTPEEIALDFDVYLKKTTDLLSVFPVSPPLTSELWSSTWAATKSQAEFRAQFQPPPMFLAGEF